MHRLESIGWTPFFASQCSSATRPAPARVCGGVAPTLLVHDGNGERPALVPGSLREEGVVTGDWVLVETGTDPSCVTKVLRRRSTLVRQATGRPVSAQVLAANVDLVLLLDSLDRPFNPRRLERLVALAWSCGIEPVVVLTKADLHPDPATVVRQASALAPGVAVHALVSSHPTTADLFRGLLAPGRTAVLVGPSGSGKSTLTNCLVGQEVRRTAQVRPQDGRGRHTTTDRHLFPVPGGGALIDGPGIRELALWAGEDGVEQAYADISKLATRCRFRDCRHAGEPGCAVAAAVAEGHVAPGRLAGYTKLVRELEVSRLRREGALRAEERRIWRPIHKSMRRLNKG